MEMEELVSRDAKAKETPPLLPLHSTSKINELPVNRERCEADLPLFTDNNNDSQKDPKLNFDTLESELSSEAHTIKGLGLMLMVLASALLVVYGICIKILSRPQYGFTTFELVFLRSFTTAGMAALTLRYAGDAMVGKWINDRGAIRDLAVRAAAGFGSVSTTTWTTSVLPLSDSTVLAHLAPIFTGILAFFFLKESYEKYDMVAGGLSLIGVVLVAKPPFLFPSKQEEESLALADVAGSNSPETGSHVNGGESLRVVATAMAIGAAFLAAVVSVQVRKMGKTIPPLQIVLFYNLSSAILCLIVSVAQFKPWGIPNDLTSALLVLTLCVCGFMQQYAFTKALSLEKASKISSMGYVQVVFSFTADYLVFSRRPDVFALVGAGFVGAGVCLIGVMKWKRGK